MSPTRQRIMNFAKTRGFFRTQDLVSLLHISRQTIASHLRYLVAHGELIKVGSTQNALYKIRKKGEAATVTEAGISLVRKLEGLEEDQVFEEVKKRMNLKSLLNKNALTIANYAFSEMLNNAIDHSRSSQVQIEVKVHESNFEFKIRDHGIGIFKNVKEYFHLENEYLGAEHVLKGKQTTFPERHSGQGIFFTSRIADYYALQSHGLRVYIDNEADDTFFGESKFLKGTLVEFKVKRKTKKALHSLFDRFTSDKDTFEFDKNILRVRLRGNRELISRSQARRLLMGLEEYKVIIFDFKDIPGIGQAFADEIFRVYSRLHPEKKISYENASPPVEFMVQRARN